MLPRRQHLIHHGVERLLQHQVDSDAFQRTPTGGVLAWEPEGATVDPYPADSGDNHILGSARRIAEVAQSNGLPHYQVVVISEDSNLLLKCDALEIKAEQDEPDLRIVASAWTAPPPRATWA